MKSKLFYLFVYYIFTVINVYGMKSNPYFFKQIGVQDGLVSGSITKVLQDSNGYIWVGTKGGLHKYNGYEFEVFRNIPEDSCSLVDNAVSDIVEDLDCNIWIVTTNAVHKIENGTSRVKRYVVNQSKYMHCGVCCKNGDLLFAGGNFVYRYDQTLDSLISESWLEQVDIFSNIKVIREDKNGNTFWLTASSGLFILNKDKKLVTHYLHSKENPFSIIKGPLSDLIIDNDERIWVSSEKYGVCYKNKDRGQFIPMNTKNSAINSDIVRCIEQVDDKNILLGTFKGLNTLKLDNMQVEPHRFNPDSPGELSYYSIHSLFVDKSKGIWVGTWKGLNYHNRFKDQYYYIKPLEFSGLIGMGKEDPDGNIWFATEGAGLFSLNTQTMAQNFYPIYTAARSNYGANIIKSICINGDEIYCATNKGAVYLFSRKRKQYELLCDFQYGDIYDMLYDCQNRLWIPTNSEAGLVVFENGKQQNHFEANGEITKFTYMKTLKELEPNVYIMGTLTNKLYKYDYRNKVLQTIDLLELTSDKDRNPRRISSIVVDKEKNIWISFFGYGVYKFNRNLEFLAHYDIDKGISDGYIFSLFLDKQDQLWAHAGKTMFLFDPEMDKFSSVYNDRNQQIEFTEQAAFADSRGILYFPGNKGVLCVNFAEAKDQDSLLNTYITSLSVNNKKVNFDAKKRLELKSDEASIEIGYAAPDYISPDQNNYAYRMDGVDKDWNVVGNRRFAYYTNLSSGKYKFRVRVGDNKGHWLEKESSVDILVHPPFYRTWWAYFFYVFVFVLIVWRFWYLLKIRHELENNIRLELMKQKNMKELHEEHMRLFSNFSHELRTPLTLILNPLEDLLGYRSFSTEVKDSLRMMRKNTQRLMLLVNNLMDMQKYNSKKMILNKTAFNLSDFIKEMHQAFVSVANNRSISFTYTLHIDPAYTVYLDRSEIEKVIFNLLSNAFKFTPANGNISIDVGLFSHTSDFVKQHVAADSNHIEDSYLHMVVCDSGHGISSDVLEKIFEPFYASSSDLHHQIAGSGIGLSLTRQIVQLHGGVIWAETQIGYGSQIHVLLPAVNAILEKPEDLVAAITPMNLQDLTQNFRSIEKDIRPTLLVVDDSADILGYLQKQLSSDFRVVTALNGYNALAMMKKDKPDLLISDVMMPEMTGLELCRRVKDDPDLMHIPVILLTARISASHVAEGYNAGADEYISKPFDITILRARINNLLTSREQIKNKYGTTLNLEGFGVTTTTQDEEFIQQYTSIIQAHFSNPSFDVNTICSELGMSRTNFYRKVKLLTNLSPAEMIKLLRLEAAAQMLCNTDMTITEILEKVAFSSSGYFAACFKAKYGMSPKEFRNSRKRACS